MNSVGTSFEVLDNIDIESNKLFKVFIDTCVKKQGNFDRTFIKMIKSDDDNSVNLPGFSPRKSMNAEFAEGSIVLMTFGI